MAAVVFNVLQFVEWPGEALRAGQPLVLCVSEEAGIAKALARYNSARVHGTTLSFKLMHRYAERPDECHAVFVESGDPYALLRMSAATRSLPILLIAEGDQALQKGAGIGLSVAGNRVVIDVDLRVLRRLGMSVSSKLLRLARTVIE